MVKKEGNYFGDYSNKFGEAYDIYEKAKERAKIQKQEHRKKKIELDKTASSQPKAEASTIVEKKIRKRSMKVHSEK